MTATPQAGGLVGDGTLVAVPVRELARRYDVVIDRGDVRKRIKKPSKPYRARYGHTPLSADEDIPWSGSQLIIGTGAYGSLPITPGLRQEADRRGVKLVATSTADACRLIASLDRPDVNAILHVTC